MFVSHCHVFMSIQKNRKRRHSVYITRVQFPHELFGNTNMAAVSLFETPIWPPSRNVKKLYGRFPFSQNFRKFPFGRKWKTFLRFCSLENTRKGEKSKKVGPFSRLEFSEQNFVFYSHVSRTLYQFQMLLTRQPYWCPIGKRARPYSGVYDQMEHLFTYRKIHFCSYRNFRIFYLNGKRPIASKYKYATVMVEGIPTLTS